MVHGVEAEGWIRYDTDAAEFLLRRLDANGGGESVPVPDSGPRILLCTQGSAQVRTGGSSPSSETAGSDQVSERGQALWLGASDTGVTVVPREGSQLFLACDGLDG